PEPALGSINPMISPSSEHQHWKILLRESLHHLDEHVWSEIERRDGIVHERISSALNQNRVGFEPPQHLLQNREHHQGKLLTGESFSKGHIRCEANSSSHSRLFQRSS